MMMTLMLRVSLRSHDDVADVAAADDVDAADVDVADVADAAADVIDLLRPRNGMAMTLKCCVSL